MHVLCAHALMASALKALALSGQAVHVQAGPAVLTKCWTATWMSKLQEPRLLGSFPTDHPALAGETAAEAFAGGPRQWLVRDFRGQSRSPS